MGTDGPVVQAMEACVLCGRPFLFNPHAVPSVNVQGVRRPMCRDCVDVVNAKRVAAGLDPFTIRPDAYEPLPAEEL
jgi:hypothetical protein